MSTVAAAERADAPQRVWRPWLTVVAVAVSIAATVALGSLIQNDLPPSAGHGLSHFLPAVGMAVLLFGVVRRWPPARTVRPGRAARRLLILGLAGVVTGQLLEVIGARVDEPTATAIEEIAHTAGMIVTTLSLPIVLLATVAALVAAGRDRAIPWWVVGAVAIAGVGLLTMMIVGAPDGS